MLSGCAVSLATKEAEEVSIGHIKCKNAGLATEIKITPIVMEDPVIEIKCSPTNQ